MSTRYRFAAGRIHPVVEIDGHAVVLGALAVALLRVAFTAAIELDPNSVFWRGIGGVIRGLGPFLPVFLLLWQYRVLDKGYAFIAVIVAASLGYAGFWLTSCLAQLGGPFAVLGELPARLLLGGFLQFLSAWLLVRALVVWRNSAWESRFWTTPRRLWPVLPLYDVGVAAMVGSLLAWIYAAAIWFGYLIGFAAAGFGVLVVSAVVAASRGRPSARLLRIDPEYSLEEKRLEVCRQLDVEPRPTSPEDDMVTGRALWYRDAITMARIETTDGPRWLIAGLEGLWDRRFWAVPRARLEGVRPDLAPLLDLPPGWVITTCPGKVWFDPAVGERLARAVLRSRLYRASEAFVDRLPPVSVPSLAEDA